MSAAEIEALLVAHQTIRDEGTSRCLCGHVYRLGEPMYAHRASIIASALA